MRQMAHTAGFFSRFEFFSLYSYGHDNERTGWLGYVGMPNFWTGYGPNQAANNMRQKQMNAIKRCIQEQYNVNTRTFVPITPGSNGYFYGLDANGNGITVETNVTHSSWYLGLAIFPPGGPVAGRTPLSTAPSQMNYVANDPTFMAEGLIQPLQLHELAHSLDMITSGSIFGSSEASANQLTSCINNNQ